MSNGLIMSILLVFMLKELSHHASCGIFHNHLEFSIYHLVYYVYANYLAIIYPAKNSYSILSLDGLYVCLVLCRPIIIKPFTAKL